MADDDDDEYDDYLDDEDDEEEADSRRRKKRRGKPRKGKGKGMSDGAKVAAAGAAGGAALGLASQGPMQGLMRGFFEESSGDPFWEQYLHMKGEDQMHKAAQAFVENVLPKQPDLQKLFFEHTGAVTDFLRLGGFILITKLVPGMSRLARYGEEFWQEVAQCIDRKKKEGSLPGSPSTSDNPEKETGMSFTPSHNDDDHYCSIRCPKLPPERKAQKGGRGRAPVDEIRHPRFTWQEMEGMGRAPNPDCKFLIDQFKANEASGTTGATPGSAETSYADVMSKRLADLDALNALRRGIKKKSKREALEDLLRFMNTNEEVDVVLRCRPPAGPVPLEALLGTNNGQRLMDTIASFPAEEQTRAMAQARGRVSDAAALAHLVAPPAHGGAAVLPSHDVFGLRLNVLPQRGKLHLKDVMSELRTIRDRKPVAEAAMRANKAVRSLVKGAADTDKRGGKALNKVAKKVRKVREDMQNQPAPPSGLLAKLWYYLT